MSGFTVRVTEALEKDFDSLEYEINEINEISYLWTEPGYRLAYRGENVGKEVHEAAYERASWPNPGGIFSLVCMILILPLHEAGISICPYDLIMRFQVGLDDQLVVRHLLHPGKEGFHVFLQTRVPHYVPYPSLV